MDFNFWENMTYFLGGLVIAGILAAMQQIIVMRVLTQGTKLRIRFKKGEDLGKHEELVHDR